MAQDLLADGFVQFCINTSLNYYDGKCKVLVEGQARVATSGGFDKLNPVTSVRDVDAAFGAGSVLAETLKKMFCVCPTNVQIFAIPRADAVGATAAVYTLTFTGPATADGRLSLYLMDADYSIDIFVPSGTTAAQLATLVNTAIPVDFPFTGVVAANVITFTAKTGVRGKIGNVLTAIPNWQGRQNYQAPGIGVTVAQTTVGVGAPVALNYASILGACCYDCTALLYDDVALQKAHQDYLDTQWDCKVPGCFGHAYTYVEGTPAQILARFTNTATMNKLALCPGDTGVPWFKAGVYAALSCCSTCTSPELSVQGRTYGVLSCINVPADCTSCFTFDEQTVLRANGFVVSGSLAGGAGVYTNPYIFNDVTNQLYDTAGRPNVTFRDTSARRLAKQTALALAEQLQQFSALGLFSASTTIKQGTFGTNARLIQGQVRAWAKSQIGILFSEFENIDADIEVKTDFETAANCQGIPGKLSLLFRYRPPVRTGQIAVSALPKVLDNCTR
jgi:hypothetical protein